MLKARHPPGFSFTDLTFQHVRKMTAVGTKTTAQRAMSISTKKT